MSAKETSLYATTYRGGSSCDVEGARFGFRVEFNTLCGNSIRSGSIDDVTRSDEFMGVSKELQLICIELPIFLLDLNGSNKTDMILSDTLNAELARVVAWESLGLTKSHGQHREH